MQRLFSPYVACKLELLISLATALYDRVASASFVPSLPEGTHVTHFSRPELAGRMTDTLLRYQSVMAVRLGARSTLTMRKVAPPGAAGLAPRCV